MPNTPLQTFRTVEGAHCGFTAAATLASQPFVLHHQQVYTLTAADTAAVVKGALSYETLSANRFQPWTLRNLDSCYPVKIPNAYNRVYVFPMFVGATDDTTAANMPTLTVTNYVSPYIMPFGMFPQTRSYSASNKLNPLEYRFPDDIIAAAAPTHTPGHSTRTNGIWSVLPSYGLNATNTNGVIATNSSSTGFGRAILGAGASYLLPDDVSISLSTTSAITASDSQLASGPVVIGMGQEYQTLGCEELAVALGSNPSGISVNIAAKVSARVYRVHFFLMGVFLG